MTDKVYRWGNAWEWLDWAVLHGKVSKTDLLILCKDVDLERIEDYFQPDMERDGYFEEEKAPDKLIETDVDQCSECSYSMDLYEQPSGKQYLLCCNCEHRDDNYGEDPDEESENE